ncbi:MAG: hypothetical protein RL172_457 [Bacteroidota bacterium]
MRSRLIRPQILTLLLVLIFNINPVAAQLRKLGFLFSENMKGGVTTFGNTLMYWSNPDGSVNLTAMNGNSLNGNSAYDNGGYGTVNMQYIDIDGNTGDGAATRNSSSADLELPLGTNTIKLARLYWGGRALRSEFNMADANNQTIKIRKGNSGAYQEYPAAQIDKAVVNTGLSTEFSRYQAFADITELVKQEGAGTYTVGNGAFSTGLGGDFGNYGGWCIVVVYENPAMDFSSVRVIDGFQEVYNGGTGTIYNITITGLNVPAGGLQTADAKLGVVTWEGDARFNGDYFKVNGLYLSNGVNQSNNIGNGTVTINGTHVTSKTPHYTDQMSLDIDEYYIGTGYNVQPGASTINFQFGTTQDQYFSGLITAVVKMTESDVKINKFVSDANNNQVAEIGETLTYRIKGKNYGAGNTTEVVLTDSLLATMIYVPGSLKINYCPGISSGLLTDVAGDDVAEINDSTHILTFRLGNTASTVMGGFLAPADSFEVEFKVAFNPVANGTAPPVVNVARVKAKSDANVKITDDATVYINGATAQQITYTFTGNGNWDDAANWFENRIPPATLPVFSTIVIDHAAGGQCILNVPQNIASGASVVVNAGKNLLVNGALSIQ